jgi:hypothetical protein
LQLYFAVKTAPGKGPNGTIRTITTDTFKLRADTHIDLAPDWQLALRGDLPFVAKNPFNSSNPNASYLYGVGDADVQAALVNDVDASWKAAFGARLITPTGNDNLGSGKWQIMPFVGARYSMPDVGSGLYVEPLVRNDASFAGNPSRKSINNLQFAPMVNFPFPDGWFFTLYPEPDIRWNFGPAVTGETGRLFLPFDALVGHKFSKGGFGGLINMSYAMNSMIHNTSWVTAHFHLIFGGAVVIMYFAVAYEMWPRITGKPLCSKRLHAGSCGYGLPACWSPRSPGTSPG